MHQRVPDLSAPHRNGALKLLSLALLVSYDSAIVERPLLKREPTLIKPKEAQ